MRSSRDLTTVRGAKRRAGEPATSGMPATGTHTPSIFGRRPFPATARGGRAGSSPDPGASVFSNDSRRSSKTAPSVLGTIPWQIKGTHRDVQLSDGHHCCTNRGADDSEPFRQKRTSARLGGERKPVAAFVAR